MRNKNEIKKMENEKRISIWKKNEENWKTKVRKRKMKNDKWKKM